MNLQGAHCLEKETGIETHNCPAYVIRNAEDTEGLQRGQQGEAACAVSGGVKSVCARNTLCRGSRKH